MFEFSIVIFQIVIGCLSIAFEVPCGDPGIDLHWPALPLDENLAFTFVCFSLPDHLLDKDPILCDFLHFFWIPGTFELLTPFVDQLKYPSWDGLVTLYHAVFLVPVGDVAVLEFTFDFGDPHHVPILRL